MPGPKTMTSLRTKLVRAMIATLVVVAFATVLVVVGLSYVSSRATLASIEGHLRDQITQKGTGIVANQALALRDLVADNAFSDVARLVERTVEQDEQVVYGLFLSADSHPWGFAGRVSGGSTFATDWRALDAIMGPPAGSGVSSKTLKLHDETVYEFGITVVDDKGAALGSLRYCLSDRPLAQALEQAQTASRRSLAMTVVVLLFLGAATSIVGMFRSRRAATRITQPLGVLTAAVNSFAAGGRSARVVIDSGDEIETLGTAFNRMATELTDYYSQLEQLNRTLEGKVEERTRALAERNRDMRLVLDNVDHGLLTVSLTGSLAPERSAIVDRWFGTPEPGIGFIDYIRRIDPLYADELDLGLEGLRDDFLPRDVSLNQLPLRIHHGGCEYQCCYSAIRTDAGAIEGVLIVIKDITAELAHAREEADGKERLALFNALAKSRLSLLAFVDEVTEQLASLPQASVEIQRRILHTLKGNAALMGFNLLRDLCRCLEDELAETCAPLNEGSLAPLMGRWRTLTDELRGMVGEKARNLIEIDRDVLTTLLAEYAQDSDDGSHDERSREHGATAGMDEERGHRQRRRDHAGARLRDGVAALALEPAEKQLRRLGEHALALANRLGKGTLALEIRDGGVRLDLRKWEGVWAEMVHLIRNAVDHGIEPEEVRRQAGKALPATLKLTTRLVGNSLEIEVADDGAGVDWNAVRTAARRRGLPHATDEDLREVLFADGLTTKTRVTGVSGRGVGLAAIRHQVEVRNGHITIDSTAGVGTTFCLIFPLSEVGPHFGVDADSRRTEGRHDSARGELGPSVGGVAET